MKTRWLVLLLLTFGSACHADRDIVYAARYYTPPGSHRTSHFHIYRINPDGTGKTQLTFGTHDDINPKWSPDGKQIAFTRSQMDGKTVLCLISANGGTVTRLISSVEKINEYSTLLWSPNGQALAVSGDDGDTAYIVNVAAHRIVRRFAGASALIWLLDSHHVYLQAVSGDEVLDLWTGETHLVRNTPGNSLHSPVALGDQIVGYSPNENMQAYFLRFVNAEGQEIKQIKIKFLLSFLGGEPVPAFAGDVLLPVSGSRQMLTYAINHHMDIGDNWDFFALDANSGTMRYLTEGAFLAWSPDLTHFCAVPRQNTTFYTKRRYPESAWEKDEPKYFRIMDKYRMVWSAPLYICATGSGKRHQITSRLSFVAGVDWRLASISKRNM